MYNENIRHILLMFYYFIDHIFGQLYIKIMVLIPLTNLTLGGANPLLRKLFRSLGVSLLR